MSADLVLTLDLNLESALHTPNSFNLDFMISVKSPSRAERVIHEANQTNFCKKIITCKLIQKFLSLNIASTLRYGQVSISYLRPVVGSIKNVSLSYERIREVKKCVTYLSLAFF